MAHTTAMPYLRLVNGEWEIAGTIEKKGILQMTSDCLDFIIWAASCSPMEKKIACSGQALKINDLEASKTCFCNRLIWQQK